MNCIGCTHYIEGALSEPCKSCYRAKGSGSGYGDKFEAKQTSSSILHARVAGENPYNMTTEEAWHGLDENKYVNSSVLGLTPENTDTPKTASDYLQQAKETMEARGKEYDKEEQGERSMAATVDAFNIITSNRLTEAEGWLFMEVLKNVRQWQQPGRFHRDSAIDGVAYSALKAEALANDNN